MKLSFCISEAEDSSGSNEGNSSSYDFEKISGVLEQELLEIYPASKNYETVEVSLTFTSPEGIRELNKTYRNIDEPTDVLSFPMIEENMPVEVPELPVLALGDIVVCPEETARLHPELEKDEAVFLMIAHSFLHLLGFDHDTEEKQEAMWRKQDTIKEKIIAALSSGGKN